MTTDYSEFHDELRSVARQLLGEQQHDEGPAVLEWPMVVDAGWSGLEVPTSLGGAGATFAEIAVILEELGRATAQSPFVGSVALGVGALQLLEPSDGRDGILADISSGKRTVALVLPVEDEDASAIPFELEQSAGAWRLTGHAPFVLDAATADRLLVLARSGNTVAAVDVDPALPGVSVSATPLVDQTRQVAGVTAAGAIVEAGSVWSFLDDPAGSCQRLRDRGAMAMACDSLGLSQAMLDATVAYASVRQQFGRPIGSFQAVQHACADMLVQLSMSRELLESGVRSVTDGAPDGWVAASMAKSYVCGAAVDVAGKAMQLHGGIGYTWESGVHAFLKRAVLNRTLFGSPGAHRRSLGGRYPL
jgi:alkylation response protein AidB-like acyl-CoA dehydrogenase